MSIVVVGSVAYDGVETPHGKVEWMLGGSCTYIALSASYFSPVKIVGVVGDDFAQEDTDLLASRGVDLDGLERTPGKTFFWKGVYSADMNDRETLVTDLNVFEHFDLSCRTPYKDAEYLFLGNIQPTLQRNVREQMTKPRITGGDTMNLWINIAREELLQTLKGWDFLLINDGEARLLSGENNLRKAARVIQDMGPNTVVIKRGEYGAMLFRGDDYFIVPGYLLEEVFDPTGAGDCFAGGFNGYLAQQGIDLGQGHIDRRELSRAVIYGSVMGSFCCERFGVDRFRTLTRAEIDGRFQEFKKFTGLSRRPAERRPARRENFAARAGVPRWGALLFLTVLSALAVFYFWRNGYLHWYGDATAHLNIARRILDGRTPGMSRSAPCGCRCRMC